MRLPRHENELKTVLLLHLEYLRADVLGAKLGARALGWVQVGCMYITLDPRVRRGRVRAPRGVQDGFAPSMHTDVNAPGCICQHYFKRHLKRLKNINKLLQLKSIRHSYIIDRRIIGRKHRRRLYKRFSKNKRSTQGFFTHTIPDRQP